MTQNVRDNDAPMVTTLLWMLTIPILIAFLLMRGWHALPRWQRIYVVIASIVAPSVVVFVDFGVTPPFPVPVQEAIGIVLGIGWMIIPFVGIVAAVTQLRLLLQKRRGGKL